MNGPASRAAEDALGAYWDWLNAGERGTRPPIDEASVAAIAHLARLDGKRAPSAAFVHALGETLADASASAGPEGRPTRAARPPRRTAGSNRPLGTRGYARLLSAAGAAVLVVSLAAAMIAVLWGTWPNKDGRQGGIQIQEATPAAVASVELVARTGVEPPEEYNWIAAERFTIAPGAGLATGTREDTGYGPLLLLVESGSVRFIADGEAMLQETKAAVETVLPAGTVVELHEGARIFTPIGVGATWSNSGSGEARLIGISAVRTNSDMSEPGQAGVTNDSPMYRTTPLGPGRLDVRLDRITLQPGAAIAGSPAAGMRMIAVESGAIEVTWAKPDEPGVATGKPFAVASVGSVDINTDRFYALEIANRTDTPAVMLFLSVDVVPSEGATPIGR